MAKKDTFEFSAMKAVMEDMKVVSDAVSANPAFASVVNKSALATAVQSGMDIVNKFGYFSAGKEMLTKSFFESSNFGAQFLFNTQGFYPTQAIDSFRNNLLSNNFSSAIEAITKPFQSPIIEAPNIALFRLNKPLIDLIDIDLPKGLRASIDSLHIRTARDLSRSNKISYNSEQAVFFLKESPDDSCKARELNVISSAARLFDDLTEEDLFSFLRYLSAYLSLGSSHYVGEKIIEIVKSIESTISFDSEYFYHARTLEDALCPYTDEDMTCAPHGITSFGRFNHIGNNYFYFSDQTSGAVEEVRKHNPKCRVQVAKLKPKGKVQMVDISQEEENVFLKYCRFPFDSHSNKKVPREYLIPSYFSDCCKMQGFDGIKYYGTKSYCNYVTWKDGHFDFISHEIKSY